MDRELRQSTATTLVLGPMSDSTDGNTEKVSLTIAQADVRLSKGAAGTFAQKNDATSCTHMEKGSYSCPVNTTDTNTLGSLVVVVHSSGALIARHDFAVLPAAVWDAKYTAGGPVLTATDLTAVADAVLDELWSGHQTIGSTGHALTPKHGVATAGAASTITLGSSASAVDNYYTGFFIVLMGGTGAGQSGLCTGYVGSTKVATISGTWTTNPASGTIWGAAAL